MTEWLAIKNGFSAWIIPCASTTNQPDARHLQPWGTDCSSASPCVYDLCCLPTTLCPIDATWSRGSEHTMASVSCRQELFAGSTLVSGHASGSCVNLVWNVGVVDPGKKSIFFPGKFPINFDFLRQFHTKKSIFLANFRKIPMSLLCL